MGARRITRRPSDPKRSAGPAADRLRTARRYPWLTATRPDTIGVRVAELPTPAQHVLDAVGAVVATSANDPGGAAPASLEEVPERIRAGVAAALDAGRLSGTPSTVIDFTGEKPVVLRVGAGSVDVALSSSGAGRGRLDGRRPRAAPTLRPPR